MYKAGSIVHRVRIYHGQPIKGTSDNHNHNKTVGAVALHWNIFKGGFCLFVRQAE